MSLLSRLDRILGRTGVALEGRRARALRQKAWEGVAELVMHPPTLQGEGATGIVFSRDRALQLHAFLGSWFSCVLSPCPLRVLYTTSDDAHRRSYDELAELWSGRVEFVRETSFRDDLLALVRGADAPRVVFFTDDGLFLDPFDLDEALRWDPRTHVFALTKGRGLRHCFVTDRPQSLPPFHPGPAGSEELLCWTWKDGDDGDWRFPLSLDGHVLGRQEMSILLEAIPFRSPNTLEGEMQVYLPLFLPREGLCFPREKLVNIPANSVQRDWKNRHTGLHGADELLRHWQEGRRIEHEAFRGLSCRDAETSAYRFLAR